MKIAEIKNTTIENNINRGLRAKILKNTPSDLHNAILTSFYTELVLDYNYQKEQISIDIETDLIVYEDKERVKPYIIVEVKVNEQSFDLAVNQVLKTAVEINAKYAVVLTQNRKRVYCIGENNYIAADLPKYSAEVPVFKYVKGQRDLKTVSQEELNKRLKTLYNFVWQGGKISTSRTFDEISKLLICKLKDEQDAKNGDVYKFQIGTGENEKDVLKRINELYLSTLKDFDLFNEEIKLEADIVYKIVEILESVNFFEIDKDILNSAFQEFFENFIRENKEKYTTPQNISQFVVKMLDIQKNDYVLDPALGLGSFLLNALKYTKNLAGIDIDDKIVKINKLNMLFNNSDYKNIVCANSLNSFGELKFDVVITDPPCETLENNNFENFTLYKNKSSLKSEILFIERCIDFLKPEMGKMAIIIPDNILTNSPYQYVRDFIMDKCQILAVVSLPQTRMEHYTIVKSSILFLRKKDKEEKINNYNVFMAACENYETENDLPQILENYEKFKQSAEKFEDNGETFDGNKKCFKINSNELLNKRLDTFSYLTKPREIIKKLNNSKYKTVKLKELVTNFFSRNLKNIQEISYENSKEINIIKCANIDNEFNIDLNKIEKQFFEKDEIKKFELKKGDILVEIKGGTLSCPTGRVILFDIDAENYVASSFFNCIRIDKMKCLPEYLFIVLRLVYNLGYMRYIQSQGSSLQRLIMDDFLDIPIPLPDLETQKKIADEYFNDLEKVKKLRQEANKQLDKTNKKINKDILGESNL